MELQGPAVMLAPRLLFALSLKGGTAWLAPGTAVLCKLRCCGALVVLTRAETNPQARWGTVRVQLNVHVRFAGAVFSLVWRHDSLFFNVCGASSVFHFDK